jgi:hypothetical protein
MVNNTEESAHSGVEWTRTTRRRPPRSRGNGSSGKNSLDLRWNRKPDTRREWQLAELTGLSRGCGEEVNAIELLGIDGKKWLWFDNESHQLIGSLKHQEWLSQ